MDAHIRVRSVVARNASSVAPNASSVARNASSVVRNASSVVRNAAFVVRNASSVARNALSGVATIIYYKQCEQCCKPGGINAQFPMTWSQPKLVATVLHEALFGGVAFVDGATLTFTLGFSR